MAQLAILAIFIVEIFGQFSLTQSAGLPSSAILPYNDLNLTSGLTSTSITTQKTIMLLHQILLQETSLRMDLEKTVREMMKEFEQMKKNQAEEKMVQEIQESLNQQLIDNITSICTENQRLKDELGQMVNNSFLTSGMQTCKCDITNITSDLQDFKKEVRHNVSLSFLDVQKEMNSTKASILQSSDDKIGAVSKDILDIQSAFKNLSRFIDRDRNLQASLNDDILDQLQNISNVIIETLPLDCKELYMNGKRKSGVYTIYPWVKSDPYYRSVQVYCDMEIEGGGWTAIQRRVNGEENFNRNWTDYKLGFGTPYGDYWIGNDVIHQLTNRRNSSLRVTITPMNDSFVSFKMYHHFYVFAEDQNYRLQLANPGNGSLGDDLVGDGDRYTATGMQFSTFDVDNDKHPGNCARTFLGGWWFKGCHSAYLTGPWHSDDWRNPWFTQYISGRQVNGTSMLIK